MRQARLPNLAGIFIFQQHRAFLWTVEDPREDGKVLQRLVDTESVQRTLDVLCQIRVEMTSVPQLKIVCFKHVKRKETRHSITDEKHLIVVVLRISGDMRLDLSINILFICPVGCSNSGAVGNILTYVDASSSSIRICIYTLLSKNKPLKTHVSRPPFFNDIISSCLNSSNGLTHFKSNSRGYL